MPKEYGLILDCSDGKRLKKQIHSGVPSEMEGLCEFGFASHGFVKLMTVPSNEVQITLVESQY